jgi:hypothetical protein
MVSKNAVGILSKLRPRTLARGIPIMAIAVLGVAGSQGVATAGSLSVSSTCKVGGSTTVTWSGSGGVGAVTFSWYDVNGDVARQSWVQVNGAGSSGSASLPTPFTASTFAGGLSGGNGKVMGVTTATCTT